MYQLNPRHVMSSRDVNSSRTELDPNVFDGTSSVSCRVGEIHAKIVGGRGPVVVSLGLANMEKQRAGILNSVPRTEVSSNHT